MEGVGGCRGEEWPHSQSILLEEQGCQEGPPWVWPAVLPARAAARHRWPEGPGSLLSVLLSASNLFTEGSWVPDGMGRDCGRWQPHELTPLWASLPPPPLWGKGCRAASDWLSCEKGGEGAGKVDACVCFQFQFLPPSLSFPPSFLFFFLFSPLLAPSVAGSLRM